MNHEDFHSHHQKHGDGWALFLLFESVQLIAQQNQLIMSAISQFAEKQSAFNARMDAALTGIAGDIESLNALIEKLQTTPGPISPEDQATLDQLQAAGEALATRIEQTDALTPPAVPSV